MNQRNVLITLFFLTIYQQPVYAQLTDKLDIRGNIQAQAFLNNSSTNWYRGGFAKLRYDEDAFPVQLGNAALHTDFRISDTFWLRSLVTAYSYPDFDPNLVEAYFQYRPLPRGKFRFRTKTGAFHLPLSLENRGIGWNSVYSTTPSVINAWVGEELRVIGGEIDIQFPGRQRGSAHSFGVTGGIFGFNDGAGTIIAYRGWAPHDRQTGLGDYLKLIPEFPGQDRKFEPFREIDDRPGYYIAGSWSYLDQVDFKFMHYDNRADPSAFRNRQIAWHTVFEHASLQINFTGSIRLLSQYMTGDTQINNLNSGFRSNVDFESWYILISKVINKHRLSARYEYFNTDDLDAFLTSIHNSNETGWAWMLAYHYQLRANLKLGLEWLQIKTNRETRLNIEGIPSETENQLLLNINFNF